MKVLFIFYTPSGGMETLNRQRSKALRQSGIDCYLVYLEHGAGLQNVENHNTYVMTSDHQINILLKKVKFDVIIVTSNYKLIPRLRHMGFKKPIIFEAQGLGSTYSARYALLEAIPYLTDYADALLYPKTPHLIQLFREIYPTFQHFSFHNCIDSKQFTYRSLPIFSNPIIGWVGRIEANKNWRDLLSIFHRLLAYRPDLRLWMFEDTTMGDEKQLFEEALIQLGLSAYIIRHSNIPNKQMCDYYSMIGDSGGFLLSTSVTEGFGYAMVEAMCCRCPILCSDSDGVRSFLLPYTTGMMYAQGDKAEAVQKGIYYLINPAVRETIRIEAKQYIEDHFSLEAYCVNFVAMLALLGIS
ncbi:glycosyltransferase family 4 protein [Paenibacillus sp. HWE-109]|uniref:glycosyltransferase family 4 protein n=1 Tax=Paenibacillus sp. HWE-109 TaxID=1306526 RepID=UPI001EDFBE08|nr:glycosyltransferase family 4 protein [Paenibacillus sp. HWE-109]UKS27637.1 glycosyltransferase family 4 protein [Paenibacillus sp. HWE-109]